MKPNKEEIEDVRKRMAFDKELWSRVGKTEECKMQANLFRSWMALCGISYAKVKNGEGYIWCPKHNAWEKLRLDCGLLIEDAIDILREEIPCHSEEVKRVRERIEKEMEEDEKCTSK